MVRALHWQLALLAVRANPCAAVGAFALIGLASGQRIKKPGLAGFVGIGGRIGEPRELPASGSVTRRLASYQSLFDASFEADKAS